MPASACNRTEDLIAGLNSGDLVVRLKSLREVKNQIIGNKTKKLVYVKLGAVPRIVNLLAFPESDENILVQSAAAIGSFALGFDAGIKAVLDSGAVPHLISILSKPDEKVVEAAARSLKIIFQSKLAPKYDVLQDSNMGFILSLLDSSNENVIELAASIIVRSCESAAEQNALCDAGVLPRLIDLLDGSATQRDASLDSLASMLRNNYGLVSKFVSHNSGRPLDSLLELVKDRMPRTKLLACTCLLIIGHVCPCYLQSSQLNIKMMLLLVALIEEQGRVGDEAPFALAELVSFNEELQGTAASANAVEKLCNFLPKAQSHEKRFQGILVSLAACCSKVEARRRQILDHQVVPLITEALGHDNVGVRIAACTCLKSLSRSVKNLSAGHFVNEAMLKNLVQLLSDDTEVQVAALGAIINIMVDFKNYKSTFFRCGATSQLVLLTKSMDPIVRHNAVWALRNLIFQGDKTTKRVLVAELTVSALTNLLCDPEPFVQEQGLALLCNLVDGSHENINLAFWDEGIILKALRRQIWSTSRPEFCTQGMLFLSNLASGSEVHKDEVLAQILPVSGGDSGPSLIIKFLVHSYDPLRLATVWCILNLTSSASQGAAARVGRLHKAGILTQLRSMINDSCLDVKFRVTTALNQCEALATSLA